MRAARDDRVQELARAFRESLTTTDGKATEANTKATAADTKATAAQRSAGLTPLDFGAVGDGAVDDTAAVRAAMQHPGTIDWLDRVYRITTPVTATLTGPTFWRSRGAVIRLDSPDAVRMAVTIEVNGQNLILEGPRLEVDGGRKAYTAIRIANTVSSAAPDLTLTGLVGRNAYRSNTAFAGGDGIYITGGFRKTTLIRPEALDCHMASGAAIVGAQGIFGITVAMSSGRGSQHILIRDALVRNVWSEDPLFTNDQDGIRIFQAMTTAEATCLIDGYVCENVANRAVKFHSVPNGICQNVRRLLDAAVVPQTVDFDNPDFDAQQAPAIFRNIQVHYKGRCHNEIVRAVTDRGDYRYGGAQVDGIDGLVENLAGNTISVVRTTSTAGDAGTPSPDSQLRLVVQNVTIVGPVARLIEMNVRGAGLNILTANNLIGDVTEAAIVATGSAAATLEVTVGNIANTATPVPVSSGFTGSSTITVTGQRGFTSEAPDFLDVAGLRYRKDPSGTALVTASATYSPVDIAGEYTPEMWGARGDGVTDDWPAIKAAVDWLIAQGRDWTLRFAPKPYRISDQIDLTAATTSYRLLGHYQLTRIVPGQFGPVKACFKHRPGAPFTQKGFTFSGSGNLKKDPIGIEARLSGRANLGEIVGNGLGNTVLFTTRPFNADWEGPFDLFFCGWQPVHKDVSTSTTTLTLEQGSAVVAASTAIFDAGDVGEDIFIYHDPGSNESVAARILSVQSATLATLDRNMVLSGSGRKFSFTAIRAAVTGGTVTFRKPIGLDAADAGRMIYVDKAGSDGTLHVTRIASVTGSGACTLADPVAAAGTYRIFFTPTVYIGSHEVPAGGTTGANDIYIDKMLVEGFKGPGIVMDGGLHVKVGELKTHGRAWGEFSNFGMSCEALIWNGGQKSFIDRWEMEFCGKSSDGGIIRVAGDAPGLSMGYMSQNSPLVGGYLFDVDFTDTERSAVVLPEINGRCNLDRFDGIVNAPSPAVRRRVFASGRVGGASPIVEASAQHPQIIGSARAMPPIFIASEASLAFRPASPGGFLMVAADDAGGFQGMFKFNSVGCVLVTGASASAVLGTASSLNVGFAGGLLTIENRSAADRRFHVAILG